MELRLTKTFLSKRPSPGSFTTAIAGLILLLILFTADTKKLSANGHLVFLKKEYWRLFTSTLLHADLNHLAHNSFYFLGLSFLLNGYFGFFVFPILSLFVGAAINLIVLHYYPPMVHLVGISGVIYFMASFWLTMYLLIERRQKMSSRIIYALGVSLILLFPQVFRPEVSYLAHGLGFALGIPVAAIYFFLKKKTIRSQEEWTQIKKDPIELLSFDATSNDFFLYEENPTETDVKLH